MAIQFPPSELLDSSDSDCARDEDEDMSASSAGSDLSDTSSDVTELDQSEFPSYFEERNGRLFHSHGSSPYPLPVDTHEQQRLNGQHVLLWVLLGAYFRGPVPQVLRPRAGTLRRALDLGTGTGQWVLDMAREFPHVRFDGIDIVPIATRSPPDNVQFEMADINEPLRYNNGTFDLVHARSISMAIRDYPSLVDQVARVLRPGGLFLACEWGRSAEMIGGRNPAEHAPYTCQFYHMVQGTLASLGIYPLARHITRNIEESGHFTHIVPRLYEVPVGDWSSTPRMRWVGFWFREMLVQYAQSMGVMMVEAGQHPAHVQHVVDGFIREMYEVQGIVCKYFTVRASRLRA